MKHIVLWSMMLMSSHSYAQGLPGEYIQIDTNTDQVIQASEVQSLIDAFFMSESAYSVEFIHDLIDFYFDQD